MDDPKAKLERIRVVVDKMPSLSTTVGKVLEICSRPDTSPNDLNKVISLDPVLTGQVLKLINSAYYSLISKVTSLTRAIIMLGLNTVKNLALSTAVIRSVKQTKKSRALPIEKFWKHSIAVGVMARLLAAMQGVPLAEREEYFVAGLLHDLGKIPFGDEYTEVLALADREQAPLFQVEQRVMGINHEEVGQMIADKWKLNASITEAICHHHKPEQASEKYRDLVAAVALADFYACLFDIGYAGNHFPDEEQLTPLLAICGMDWEAVGHLNETLETEIKRAEIFLRV